MSKTLKIFAIVLALALILVACGEATEEPTEVPEPTKEEMEETETMEPPAPTGEVIFFSTQFSPVEEQETFRALLQEAGFDFTHGSISLTYIGVGVGRGFYVSVSTASFDIGARDGWWATVGYNMQYDSLYVSASYGSFSGTYYFASGVYSVGAGWGNSLSSVSVSYSNAGGWSAGGGMMGANYTYNFATETGRLGFTVDVEAWKKAYWKAFIATYYNGHGPAGSTSSFWDAVNFVGLVCMGALACDLHDFEYLCGDKGEADLAYLGNNLAGSISNLGFAPNGIFRAIVGIALSPFYYIAVAGFGGDAYQAAQQEYLSGL